MNVQDIENYYDRAAGCLFVVALLWALITGGTLYGISVAWADVDLILLGKLWLWLAGSVTMTLMFYAAYALVRSAGARAEIDLPRETYPLEGVVRPGDPSPEHYL